MPLRHYTAIALLLAAGLIAGIAIGRYAAPTLNELAFKAKRLLKSPDELLAASYQKVGKTTAPFDRAIETSRLPLTLNEHQLGETGLFASGGPGGSIVSINGNLVLLDRLGNFFAFKDGKLDRLDFGGLPNNLKEFLADASASLNLPAFRTLSMVYDAPRLYVSHQRYNSETQHQQFAISAISIDDHTMKRTGNWETVFQSEDITHSNTYLVSGGKMVLADRKIYFTTGDYATGELIRPSEFVAQDLKSSFGKIFELDPKTKQARMIAAGFRNPQGLTYTTAGELISAEHGPEGGDEINIIAEGKNYGWPYDTKSH